MEQNQNLLYRLQEICQQQHEEITQKKVQIWDLEEEHRVFDKKLQKLRDELKEKQNRIDELERWCGHLQGEVDKLRRREGIVYKIGRKIKRIL